MTNKFNFVFSCFLFSSILSLGQTIIHDDAQYTELEIQFSDPVFTQVNTGEGMANIPFISHTTPILKKGAPQLLSGANASTNANTSTNTNANTNTNTKPDSSK